jgi:hypothetical protein
MSSSSNDIEIANIQPLLSTALPLSDDETQRLIDKSREDEKVKEGMMGCLFIVIYLGLIFYFLYIFGEFD